MADRASNQKRDFNQVLEQGAKVDDIFKDSPAPKGSDPFSGSIEPLAIEDAATVAPPAMELAGDGPQVGFVDNDSLFCINRKFAAAEAMLKIVSHEYYPFGQLISEILKIAMEQVPTEAGSFIEVDHDNDCMFFRAVSGRSSQNLLNFTIPSGQGVVGFVCENQQSMTLSSVDDSSVYLRSISDSVGFETKNMAAYPVIIRGVTFGCIELLNRLGEPQFTDADKEILASVCDFAGRVIENRLVMAAMWKELEALTKKNRTPGEAA